MDIATHSTLPTNLVSYWPLKEKSGERLDVAGPNKLADNNTVGWAPGKIGVGADFETSTSEYLSITDGDQSGLDFSTAFSVSMWVKHESVSNRYYLRKGVNSGQRAYEIIGFDNGGTDTVRFTLSTNGTTTNSSDIAFLSNLSTGVWYHLVFMYDGTNTYLYRDGVSQGSSANSTSSIHNSTEEFRLGTNSPTQSFDGVMDEVGAWSKKLTTDEISDLYNSGDGIPYLENADIKNHSTLTTSLVSYWDLEEASGKRYDLHGSNDLDDNNTVGVATGKIGNGADFEGSTSEYLSITDGSQTGLDQTGNFSISTWVKFESVSASQCLINKWLNDSTGGGYALFWFQATNTLYFRRSNSSSGLIDSTASFTPSAGTWYHIVCTFSTTNGSVIYINGSSAGTGASTVASSDTTASFFVGVRDRGGTKDWYLDGVADEIGIWSKELTSTEVTNLYNSGSGLPYYSPDDVKNDTTLSTSLVSYWELEEASGTRTDSHGSNDLVETNTPGQVVGIQGNAADFDGTVGEALSTSSGTGFTMTNAASFSIAGWFKPNNAASFATLFARWAGTSKGFLVRQNASDQVEAYVGDGSTTRGVVTGSADIDDTNWHHVVFVWDATTDKQSIYVDGVLDATIGSAQTISQSTAEIEIGDDTQATSGANYNGAVDEMAAYTKALSVGEIRALYGYGAPPEYDAGGATPTLYNALALCNF